MSWRVDPNLDVPPWRQVVEHVLDGVATGVLEVGDRLPSVRVQAAQAHVNHNTVARAYRELEQLGVVRGETGRGVFVQGDGPAIARDLRRAATAEALRSAARAAHAAGYTLDELVQCLRETLAGEERKSA